MLSQANQVTYCFSKGIIVKVFSKIFSAISVFGMALFLAGCKSGVLSPVGKVAASEKEILIDAVLLMLLVVVPVILINFWFAWRYRSSNKKATYCPDDHNSTTIEVICWTIPIIIIVVLGIMTWISTHKLDPYRPLNIKGKPLTIQAVALNWKWLFIYPKQNIATVNYVRIPKGRQVRFLVTSDAPMNSLAMPRLSGQIYAMGGMQTKLHIVGDKIGRFRGLSTNYSGAGFSGMHFNIDVTTEKAFKSWVKTVKSVNDKLSLARYTQLTKDSENNPVQYFSSVHPNLYHNIIMQFNAPSVAKNMTKHGAQGLDAR